MRQLRLLDLYCCAGGASVTYARAGFEVVGVDLAPQSHYPFEFHQADALDYLHEHGHEFDAITASPPCQRYSAMRKGRWQEREHPDLIAPTREALRQIGKPFVIENVEGARNELIDPVMLCGTMFNLATSEGSQLRRHRLFEYSWEMPILTPLCNHNDGSPIGVYGSGQHPYRRRPATIGVWGNGGGHSVRDNLDHYGIEARREAMGIDWMTSDELSESIPPAYTAYIGIFLRQGVERGYPVVNKQAAALESDETALETKSAKIIQTALF